MPLDREEYVEQAYFFQTLRERMQQEMSTQDLLDAIRQEVLATTMLPFALDFMSGELRLTGGFATAMARLPHYFTPFQTYVVGEAEKAEGRFDFRIALEILQREVEYRAAGALAARNLSLPVRNPVPQPPGLRPRAGGHGRRSDLRRDWREWILTVRRQVGLIDFGDMIYVRSELYRKTRKKAEKPILFGEKEGRIALANRRKDPLYLFSALQRHLGYPSVPRPRPEDTQRYLLPALQRHVDRLETRMKLLEEELRGGINLSRFYAEKGEKSGRVESGVGGEWLSKSLASRVHAARTPAWTRGLRTFSTRSRLFLSPARHLPELGQFGGRRGPATLRLRRVAGAGQVVVHRGRLLQLLKATRPSPGGASFRASPRRDRCGRWRNRRWPAWCSPRTAR